MGRNIKNLSILKKIKYIYMIKFKFTMHLYFLHKIECFDQNFSPSLRMIALDLRF